MARAMILPRHDKENEMSSKQMELEVIAYPLSSLGLIKPIEDDDYYDDSSDRYYLNSDRPTIEPNDSGRRAYWCRDALY
jgi:hypothetical protein